MEFPVVAKRDSDLEEEVIQKQSKKQRQTQKREQAKGKYGPKNSSSTEKVWSAPQDVLDEVEIKPQSNVQKAKQKEQKAKINRKEKRRDVKKNLSDELLLEILRELTEDTPEARQLLGEIAVKVDFLKKLDDLRKI